MVIATDQYYVNRVEKDIFACDTDGTWKTYHTILLTTHNNSNLNTDIKRK